MTLAQDDSTLYDEAHAALARGDLKQASSLCQSLLNDGTPSARGYHLMSALFQATGNYRKAFDYASLATQMDNCVAQYHMQQGMILFALKSYDQAVESFKRAAELDQTDAQACVWAGNCCSAQERYTEAHAWYARARQVSQSAEIMLAEAECYLQAGEYTHAESQLAQCLKAYPKNAHAHYLIAMCSLAGGDTARAEISLRKAVALDSRHVSSHFYLALIVMISGDEEGAIKQSLEVLQHAPTHIPSLLLLGNIFIKKGDAESAAKAFSHVLALVPDHILVWQQLMQLYSAQDRLAEAHERLKEVIVRATNPVALKHVRSLYRNDTPPFAPKEYIAAIYDELVGAFEYWLLAAGEARHVAQISEQLRACAELRGKRHLALLDIGCNTGKTAELLENITSIRVGVELSSDMAKLARRSKRYDIIYELDATDYVLASEAKFDVVVAVGALRWMGNLQPFFHGVRNVMHPHSLFAFVISKEHSQLAYTVSQDGRYQHNIAYIQDMASAEGFIIVQQKELLWFDADDGVISRHLFILKKMTLH